MINLAGFRTMIDEEAWKRTRNQELHQNVKDLAQAYKQNWLGVGAEIAACIQIGLDPKTVECDVTGRPDIRIGETILDVKSMTERTPNFSVQAYDGVLDNKDGWKMLVMKHYTGTWEWEYVGEVSYDILKNRPTFPAAATHRTPFWLINVETTRMERNYA